jgi:hypothetical protein
VPRDLSPGAGTTCPRTVPALTHAGNEVANARSRGFDRNARVDLLVQRRKAFSIPQGLSNEPSPEAVPSFRSMTELSRKKASVSRRYDLVFTLLALLFGVTAQAQTDRPEKDCAASDPTAPLAATKLLTLVLDEKDQTASFSMTVASRRFSLALGDRNIRLRGELRQVDRGREILDYTLQFTRMEIDEDGIRQRIGNEWRGSTFLSDDRTVEIATFLDGSFSLHWKGR